MIKYILVLLLITSCSESDTYQCAISPGDVLFASFPFQKKVYRFNRNDYKVFTFNDSEAYVFYKQEISPILEFKIIGACERIGRMDK